MCLGNDLRRVFERYGDVVDIWVARQPPGFAFVEVRTDFKFASLIPFCHMLFLP